MSFEARPEESHRLEDGREGVFVHQMQLGPWDNFIYFVGDRATRKCAVVDPAWHAPSILKEAERLDLEIAHVLCTHSHFDHVNRVDEVLKTHDVPVHMLDREIAFSGFRSENLTSHRSGDRLTIGKHVEVQFVHTPGHTPGSVSYRVRGGLVTGDTLFVQGCGRCDFVGGDPEVMFGTLNTLLGGLPPATVLYPGHNYGPSVTSTPDAELEKNPFLQLATVEDFVAHRMAGKTPGTHLPSAPDWTPA